MQLTNIAVVLNTLQTLGFEGPLLLDPEFLPDYLLLK